MCVYSLSFSVVFFAFAFLIMSFATRLIFMFFDVFLRLCVQVFKHYFEVLEEESLRDNFVVVVIDL